MIVVWSLLFVITNMCDQASEHLTSLDDTKLKFCQSVILAISFALECLYLVAVECVNVNHTQRQTS